MCFVYLHPSNPFPPLFFLVIYCKRLGLLRLGVSIHNNNNNNNNWSATVLHNTKHHRGPSLTAPGLLRWDMITPWRPAVSHGAHHAFSHRAEHWPKGTATSSLTVCTVLCHIGTIDFYHFIPLSLTLTLAGGRKVSTKQNLLASFSETFFVWCGWNVILWQSNLSWTSWDHFWMRICGSREVTVFWLHKKNLKHRHSFGYVWTDLFQRRYKIKIDY